jgi:hypothetical protein
MSYVLELDVGACGYLYGGDDLLAVDPVRHSWCVPYPPVGERMQFAWDPGDSGCAPNVFGHNLLRDFVCDDHAFRVLTSVAGGDLHVVGRGELNGANMTALQVTTVLDVVDEGRSIPSEYSWARISFPHIGDECDEVTAGRIFRVANRELSLLTFVGDSVKLAIEAAGIVGWRYEPARVDE